MDYGPSSYYYPFHRQSSDGKTTINDPQVSSTWAITLPGLFTYPILIFTLVFIPEFYLSLGVSLKAMLIVLAISRALDCFIDPAIAFLSDSCKDPTQRRESFYLPGALFYAVSLACLFCPPSSLKEDALVYWFAVSYIGMMSSFSLVFIPYSAIIPEAASKKSVGYQADMYFTAGLFELCGLFVVFMSWSLVHIYGPNEASSSQDSVWLHPRASTEALRKLLICLAAFYACGTVLSILYLRYCSRADHELTKHYMPVSSSSSSSSTVFTWKSTQRAIVRAVNSLISTTTSTTTTSQSGSIDRDEAKDFTGPSLVPTLFSLLYRNDPSALLMGLWFLDTLSLLLVLCSLGYFVRYVIQPEYTISSDFSGDG